MNLELWDKILEFDLDLPQGEYGFSTRLAHENTWTISFTNQAILEYKKFMYLAATADQMVSPSEIIDKVWHQHLIFTKSYHEFCQILGKQIHHIPSTHRSDEIELFKQAKEKTSQLYQTAFGQQPSNIWEVHDMMEGLHLKKASLDLKVFVQLGIVGILVLLVPAYFLLRPLYVHINNPFFILGLSPIIVVSFLLLEIYNKAQLKKIVSKIDATAFIFHLNPTELVYLKTQQISSVITGVVNELIRDEVIQINANKTLELVKDIKTTDRSNYQIISILSEKGTVYYPFLLQLAKAKPAFISISNSMDAFRKHFIQSKHFGKLFYTNFAILAVLFIICFTRIVTGSLREKPIVFITILTLFLMLFIVLFLYRLSKQISTNTLPTLYKQELLTTEQIEENNQWNYFLLGSAFLATSFVPLVNYTNRSSGQGGYADGGSSSCGSGCGSSCGGCGGCGGS